MNTLQEGPGTKVHTGTIKTKFRLLLRSLKEISNRTCVMSDTNTELTRNRRSKTINKFLKRDRKSVYSPKDGPEGVYV